MKQQFYIKREIEKTIKRYIRQFPALVLSGPRQSGKSTLLKNLFKENYHFYSFDDPFVRQKALLDPELFLSEIKEPAVFDEIQYVPQLLNYLKISIDENRAKKGRFILTGSQQFNLMKNIGDTLAGRIGILNLLPFSREEKEFYLSTQKEKNKANFDYFADACLRGSYPEISVHKEVDFEAWYNSYLQTYLERDIRTLYEIGNLRDFQRFIQILAARCAQILNLSSLAAELGVSVNTIKRWISILEASQIIFILSPYYQNMGKRITKNPKIYFTDCGLVCYLIGVRDKKQLMSIHLLGALFENYIVQETIKAFINQGKMPRFYYLRTHNGLEIDLIIEEKMRIFPIEIKASKSLDIKMTGPIERFNQLFTNLNIARGQIISMSSQMGNLSRNVAITSVDHYLNWLKGN